MIKAVKVLNPESVETKDGVTTIHGGEVVTPDNSLNQGEEVRLKLSGERGQVVGIATYSAGEGPDRFYVRYVNAMGVQTEGWFYATELGEKSDFPNGPRGL